MNCPHHHKVFAAQPRAIAIWQRLAEYGQVSLRRFRCGRRAVRVRGMSMNDAHIYCTKEQIKDEFKAVIQMSKEAYGVLGLTISGFACRVDPEDPKAKYVDNSAAWAEVRPFWWKCSMS